MNSKIFFQMTNFIFNRTDKEVYRSTQRFYLNIVFFGDIFLNISASIDRIETNKKNCLLSNSASALHAIESCFTISFCVLSNPEHSKITLKNTQENHCNFIFKTFSDNFVKNEGIEL